jgi:hypothetical protein
MKAYACTLITELFSQTSWDYLTGASPGHSLKKKKKRLVFLKEPRTKHIYLSKAFGNLFLLISSLLITHTWAFFMFYSIQLLSLMLFFFFFFWYWSV